FSRIKGKPFLLFLPCFCSGQLAPPLLCFSTFLVPSNMVCLLWDHDVQELMTCLLQVHTTALMAFGFSPHQELPGSVIDVFPNGSIYFSVS
ncbi:MOXD2 protein, partial [Chloroceryle aenea]|nr:MOXD2 protein [Chloroceryle aenea]